MPFSHLLLALIANAAWAFNFIAGKAGVAHFPPLLFTTLRFALLVLLLLPWLRPVPGQMRRVLVIAVVMGVIHFSMIFGGLAAAGDVSSVAIATQLYVPMSVLAGIWWLGERPEPRRLLGTAIAFAGVLVIGFDPVVFRHPLALALIAGASAAFAGASILMRGLKGVGVFTMQAWIALAAVLGLTPLTLLFEHGQVQAIATASWLEWGAPAYSAIGSSLVGHGIVYWLLKRHPVGVTAPLMLLSPVLAVIFGVTLWGDQLSWKLVVGGLMTLAGVAVINVRWPLRGARP